MHLQQDSNSMNNLRLWDRLYKSGRSCWKKHYSKPKIHCGSACNWDLVTAFASMAYPTLMQTSAGPGLVLTCKWEAGVSFSTSSSCIISKNWKSLQQPELPSFWSFPDMEDCSFPSDPFSFAPRTAFSPSVRFGRRLVTRRYRLSCLLACFDERRSWIILLALPRAGRRIWPPFCWVKASCMYLSTGSA